MAPQKDTRTLEERAAAQSRYTRKARAKYLRAKAHLGVLKNALRRRKGPRRKMIDYASRFVGITENPPGSNTSPQIDKWGRLFGVHAVYWCGVFAGAMLRHVGVPVNGRVIYAPYIKEDAKRGRNGFKEWTTDFHKVNTGDIGTLWNGEHIVIVAGHPNFKTKTVPTIEGNTSFGDGSQSNGGAVARKTRKFSDFDGFAKPAYPKG